MRKFFPALFILALAAAFLLVSAGIKKRPDIIHKGVSGLKMNCAPNSLRCNLLAPIIKDANNVTHGLNRAHMSKDDLPIIRVYLSDGAVAKIANKRKSVLAMPKGIHISNKDDWVKAEILVEYEGYKETSKVVLRLKGDWADHFVHDKKLSFRVKTKGGGYLFGVKTFSLQHPATRAYGYGPLLLGHMRRHDILAPRQKFVDLYVNDFPIGIMAMEEHFGKEMLEAQNRREGPILAIDEGPLWAQLNNNHNISVIDDPERVNFFGYRDGAIKDYNGSRYKKGSIPTNNQLRGQALLRDFLDGRAAAGESFDYDKLAKHWILTNIWGGCHAEIWHNRRFYFNPISGLLEPISFDNDAAPWDFKMCLDVDTLAAFGDPVFRAAARAAARDIQEEITSAEFAAYIKQKQDTYETLFNFEHFSDLPPRMEATHLQANLERLVAGMNKMRDGDIDPLTLFAEHGYYGGSEGSYVRPLQVAIDESLLRDQDLLATHLTSYYYPEKDSGAFEFRNLTHDEIELKSIYVLGKKNTVRALNFTPFILGSAAQNPQPITQQAIVSDSDLSKYKSFKLDYIYKGEPYTRTVVVQFKNAVSGYVGDPIAIMSALVSEGGIDETQQQITFSARTYDITRSVSLPKGWSVHLIPGAELNFKDGAVLKISGPLTAKGTKTAPIIINVESSETFMDMGAWGGIFVSKSTQRSEVEYLRLYGTATQNLQNRQGYYGLTGCMSFYESDVDIRNSKFIDAQCEDALNIVKSNFVLDNIVIDGARADAFDSDFSMGAVHASVFKNSGNDGIDVSGTQLSVFGVKMQNIGDKALSIGEKSNLNGSGITIDGAVLGLVSKDLSIAFVSSTSFKNIEGTALMTYIKKQEYGPSSIECEACTFSEGTVKTGQQETTKITLNGAPVTQTKLTRAQMVQAGLIEEAEAQ